MLREETCGSLGRDLKKSDRDLTLIDGIKSQPNDSVFLGKVAFEFGGYFNALVLDLNTTYVDDVCVYDSKDHAVIAV